MKEISLKKRQEWDIILWFFIMLFGGLTFFFFKMKLPIMIPVAGLLVSFYLMYRNNKIALKEIKGVKGDGK